MNSKLSDYKKYFIIITFAIVAYLCLSNIGGILQGFYYVLGVLSPILIGIVIAYILNIVVNLYENKAFKKFWPKHLKIAKHKRLISVLITLLSIILVLSLLIIFIVPQVAESFNTLMTNIPNYLQNVSSYLGQIITNYNISVDIWSKITENWKEILNSATNFVSIAMPQIIGITKGVTNGIFNIFIGIVIAIYLLFSKEKMIRIIKKIIYAFINEDRAYQLIHFGSFANRVFHRFIGGQITEAFILGTLTALGLLILRIPYALLIGVIIAITSFIPLIGTFIGIIFSSLILLMINPIRTLWFIIYILILQQIEGNLIYPRIVGNAVGISGIWILTAIIIGGSFFGMIGMLVAVPVFSILYAVIRSIVNKRLKRKEITVE